MLKKLVPAIIFAAVIGGGIGIVASSMSAGVFQTSVAEALGTPERFMGREFKVTGEVVKGSVRRGPGPFDLEFAIKDTAGEGLLRCRYRGTVPDPFAEGREVILQGVLREGPLMEVSKITVKCPSKYQEEGLSEEEAKEYYERKYMEGHRGPSKSDM